MFQSRFLHHFVSKTAFCHVSTIFCYNYVVCMNSFLLNTFVVANSVLHHFRLKTAFLPKFNKLFLKNAFRIDFFFV